MLFALDAAIVNIKSRAINPKGASIIYMYICRHIYMYMYIYICIYVYVYIYMFMSHCLHSSKGGIWGTVTGLIDGATRSLDYSSYIYIYIHVDDVGTILAEYRRIIGHIQW